MRIHFVVHESFEAPGAFETWGRRLSYTMTYSRVYEGDSLPANLSGIDVLIVMGGPQSASTPRSECPHFDAAGEKLLIAQAIAANRVVIGVCLGAQLMGEALGAACTRSPEKEIGKFPITLTDEGAGHAMLGHFGQTIDVGHWHSDMPGLTAHCKVLAHSQGCPRQIIEYGPLAFGLQCHMEFTPEVIELLIAASEQELTGLSQHRFVQQPEVLRRNDYRSMNEMLYVFLDKLVATYRGYRLFT
ncbi:MAG TPA: hypothetical protein VHZ99_14065 [Steroidobacteraceae bacterium]|jgi:GMP synthase (glutamine-hydrolysing)|nr:hypothetical protein [Steroidobacteraceae bacterium]